MRTAYSERMETIDRGSASSARVAIVGRIHGDEPAGERIVRRLADELDEEGRKGPATRRAATASFD